MTTPRIGTLKPGDRQAVFASAKRLGLDPYEFGALIHQESGFRPNVYGGAGGNYYGLIQFGGPERAKYLDKSKLGNYTIAEQMPAVEQFLRDHVHALVGALCGKRRSHDQLKRVRPRDERPRHRIGFPKSP